MPKKPEKTGFVYIWFDSKHKMYYIGCHVGREDDGYICSSNRMRDAYRRRPEDFKRRILTRDVAKSDLLEEEYRWLKFIKPSELRLKYYNQHNHHFGHWTTSDSFPKTRDRFLEAMSKRKGRPLLHLTDYQFNSEHVPWNKGKKGIQSAWNKGTKGLMAIPWNKGVPMSEETKKKISNSNKGRGGRKKGTKPNMTPEGRAKIIAMKTGNIYCLGKRWSWSEDQKERVRGRVCSEEMREKLSVAQKKRFENTPNPFLGKTHSVETKMAISNFHKGNKWAAIKIIDIKAGTIFNSVRDAADSIGMKRSTLSMMIKNHNPNKTNFRYYTDNA